MKDNDKPYYTLNQFSKLASISIGAVLGHIKRGNIKTTYRVLHAIPKSELDVFLNQPKDKLGRRIFKKPLA